MMLLVWMAGSVLAGIVIGALAGRFGVAVGVVILLLGAGPMAALYIYESSLSTPRDMSSEGMLSTVAFIFVAPAGLSAIVTGWLNRR